SLLAQNMFGQPVLKRLTAAVVVLMLGACAVGPDYQRPSVDTGLAYKEALKSGAYAAASQGWVPAQPGDAALRGDWWQMYSDPVLSALMDSLQEANLNIIQAAAQYRRS